MMKGDIHVASLIERVSENPCIWDKTVEGYHSKPLVSEAWKNICSELFENFEELPEKQKAIYGKSI